jgi:hypothetical protein
MNSTALPKNLKIGSIIVILAGFVPLTVSTVLFLAFVSSSRHPGDPWLSGQFPPGPANYSLNAIKAFNPSLAIDFMTAQHIELVNVMNSGLSILLLAIFGLRRYQKWAWWAILGTSLWAGMNDTIALFIAHDPPAPLVGEIFCLVGLALARGPIWNANRTMQ